MSSIYAKGKRIYFRLKVDGQWVGVRTEFEVGEERAARAMLDRLDKRRAAGEPDEEHLGPMTVQRYSARWLKARKAHVQTWANDESMMRLHVLPALGALRLDEVRPLHLVQLVRSWRARAGAARMAPKSIYNGYSTLSALFRDAALEDLISASPCLLTKHQLGPKVDANPEWRRSAVFTLAELEQLISDRRIPLDRRVMYGLQGIGGARHGEAAGLLWRNVDLSLEPLGMMLIAYSYERPFPKGDVTRPVPIHPTLAAMLSEWKLVGWRKMFGRAPKPDDLVVPMPLDAVAKARRGKCRPKGYSYDRLTDDDLPLLGLRHRRGHDLRRTFISLARSNGAEKDILRRATHKPPREVIEGYTSFEWAVVCREIAKLQVKRHDTGAVIALPRAVAVNDSPRATLLATVSPQLPMAAMKTALAFPGLEPGTSTPVEAEQAASTGVSGRIPDASAGGQALGRPVEPGSGANDGSKVANALAELLELARAMGVDPKHPAMVAAAAALDPPSLSKHSEPSGDER